MLVTGAAGFIGTNLVPALDSMYDEITCVDLVAPPAGAADTAAATWVVADMLDVLPSVPRHDTVIHLAANVGGRSALEQQPLSVAANLSLDVAFFEHITRTRPARAVYVSSSAVYAARRTDTETLHEGAVDRADATFARPDDLYGWVKLTGEQLAHVVATRYGVPITVYRPFSLYGPGQPVTYPVPAIVRRAADRQSPLTVWGTGRQMRDFVHVDDAVSAIVASHLSAPTCEPINICSGIGTTFAEVARLAAAAVGYDPEIVGDTDKPGGVDHRVGSPDRLREWFTTKIEIADGVEQLVELQSPA